MHVSEDGTGLKPEAIGENEPIYHGEFPRGFLFGSSTVAHQVEGVSAFDGKGASIWDDFSHSHPKYIADRSTADETCDSYNNFLEDVIALKYLNANAYNFTISWSRILPDGLLSKINHTAISFYDDLINTLLENGIEPIATLHHWDLPLHLLKKYPGGWMNEQLILAFESFARVCFEKFGDRVKQWITIAQPWEHSWKSYGSGLHPPNLCLGRKGALISNTNLLKAHAKVYRLYEKRYKSSQGGKVGISFGCSDDNDITQLSSVLHPLLYGDYPKIIPGHVNSKESIECSCPIISDDWKDFMKGSFDFISLQYSTKQSVATMTGQSDKSSATLSLRSLLNIFKVEFENPEILVSCEGPSLTSPSQMMDMERAQYFSQISSEILKANKLDGCNVKGFFPGKLMDCWEWESGYTISYGLFHVDISHPSKKRSPRASVAFMLKQLFKEKKLQDVLPL